MRASRARAIRKETGRRSPGRKFGGGERIVADYIEYIDEEGKTQRMTKEALRIQRAMAEERARKDAKNERVRAARAAMKTKLAQIEADA